MKAYGGVDVYIHIFLISVVAGGEWPASLSGHFTPGNHWTGDWVDSRVGLDDLDNINFLTLPGPVAPVAGHYTDWATPAPGEND
jgi:hypothetical protein